MKRHSFKTMALLLVLCVCIGLAACTPSSTDNGPTAAPAATASAGATATPASATATPEPKETIYVEWWRNNQEGITWEKDGPVSQWLVEHTGVGMYSPLVIWEGGTGYSTKLQTRIATNDLPDIFMPRDGVETTLIEDGMIWEITDYLQQYAPHVWELIPERIWDVVRTSDPTGEGGIYYIPNVQLYNGYAAFIRKDWLDDAGLAVPTNQEEYVAALRAFKERGGDVLPTIGRELGRWMDHLFFMYDVAMFEGYPCFDLYDGEITYSAVTPNMREALAFIRDLYAEELLDNEVFLNKANNLWEKVKSDRVGSWYHIPYGLNGMALNDLLQINPEAEVVVLPRIAAPGYDGYITVKQVWGPYWAFGKNDEETLIASLTLLDWLADPANYDTVYYGVEGIHHTLVDGKPQKIYDFDVNAFEKLVSLGIGSNEDQIRPNLEAINNPAAEDYIKNGAQQTIDALTVSQQDRSRSMVDDGVPATVYEGFPDIASRKLYQEYMAKIITGELPIEAFDEFVTQWYATGGEEVTQRVREWYAQTQG